MIPVILEAAFRSLLMAAAVWAGIRMMRVQAVLAQKLAWVLVLLAAGIMPLVMRAPIPVAVGAVQIPATSVFRAEMLKAEIAARPLMAELRWALLTSEPLGARTAGGTMMLQSSTPARTVSYLPKPHPAHRMVLTSDSGTAIASDVVGPSNNQKAGNTGSPRSSSALLMSPASLIQSLSQPRNFGIFSWLRGHVKELLTLAYMSVAVFLLFRTLAGLAVALRLWLRSKPVPELKSMYVEGQTRVGTVRASRDLVTPVTIGSTVILPANHSEWGEDKLRIVLAHERSHVRQGDFYLQLLAAAHVAIFWFSPLGWWLKRKLSELGETLSDAAGLQAAPDASTYAQVLLEFAAMPRTSPVAGVPMARSGSLSARIDQILNISRLKAASVGGRRHVVLSASLVLVALVAVVACIRIVPPVEAAQAQAAAKAQTVTGATSGTASTGQSKPAAETIEAGEPQEAATGQVDDETAPQITDVPPVPSVDPSPAVTIAAPQVAPTPSVTPEPSAALAPRAPYSSYSMASPGSASMSYQDTAPGTATGPGSFAYGHSRDGDDNGSFAIIRGNGNVTLSGRAGKALEEAKRKYHNNFLWFERDGKSYVITDPSIMGQFNDYDQRNKGLERQQAQLQMQQDELNQRMKEFDPSKAKVMTDSPEMKKQMAELNRKLTELQSEKFKKMTGDINGQVNQEMLSDLQSKMGQIQAQIGEIQGHIGEEMGRLGEKQGELGEQMGHLGEQMGRIGEAQGRLADQMNERVQSLIDRAMQNGTAKPVN